MILLTDRGLMNSSTVMWNFSHRGKLLFIFVTTSVFVSLSFAAVYRRMLLEMKASFSWLKLWKPTHLCAHYGLYFNCISTIILVNITKNWWQTSVFKHINLNMHWYKFTYVWFSVIYSLFSLLILKSPGRLGRNKWRHCIGSSSNDQPKPANFRVSSSSILCQNAIWLFYPQKRSR